MQFRCFQCGLVFADGPPPLEALDRSQAAAVGTSAPETNHNLFAGTKLEGMSPYSFCSFCLLAISYFPDYLEVEVPTPPRHWWDDHGLTNGNRRLVLRKIRQEYENQGDRDLFNTKFAEVSALLDSQV